jgi:hypothetical protein
MILEQKLQQTYVEKVLIEILFRAALVRELEILYVR